MTSEERAEELRKLQLVLRQRLGWTYWPLMARAWVAVWWDRVGRFW